MAGEKYREQRDASERLMQEYTNLLFKDAEEMDLKRDNANIDSDAPMGIMLKLGTEGAKCYADHFAIPEKFAKADRENYIHIHDKDFSFITFNCCQIDLLKLFKGGFSTGHGFLREPNSVRAAASLACIAIQSNQNDMFGGQSINALDYALAPYVEKSYRKHLADAVIESYLFLNGIETEHLDELRQRVLGKVQEIKPCYKCVLAEEQREALYVLVDLYMPNAKDDREEFILDSIIRIAEYRTEDETKQAMEALIHNFNTLHSRAGAQVPFSSINYGLCTSPAGRLVISKTLDAIEAGLGNGETPIFPISVFQLKAGVNYNLGDPNHDMFQRACAVSAKRLFPNFVNIDAPYNLQYYKKDDYNSAVATMGCRTRVMANVNGPEESGSRGNFAFVTINLPMIALEARECFPDDEEARIRKFYEMFDEYIEISRGYLEYRYQVIAEKRVYNYPFLMGQGVWMDSDKLNREDKIGEVLKHCSISIGFCGLAECLVALVGKHHGESKRAQELGLAIVGHLRERTDGFTEETHMNWTTFATPAESTAGQFLRAARERFGIVKGVTEREYFTNSSHVPVYYQIKAMDKIRVEAPYHALENAGHIAYIEMDGNPSKNLKAFEQVVRAMHDADMGYFSINHPVDRDPVCGYTGVIENECPKCHRREDGHYHEIVRRIKI